MFLNDLVHTTSHTIFKLKSSFVYLKNKNNFYFLIQLKSQQPVLSLWSLKKITLQACPVQCNCIAPFRT